MKKMIPAILVLALIISTATAFGADYKDMPDNHWANDAVSTMSEQGVVKGYNDGKFKPANTVTYAEFIKMAVIAAGNNDPGNNTAEGHWAKNYYDLAVEKGYFTEFDITKTQLDREIPRGDMALIISNILGDTEIKNYTALENSVSDVDYKTENDYDIIKTYASGIITGYTDGTFKPKGTLNRAESATVIYRLTDESKRVMPDTRTEEEKIEDAKNDYVMVKTADYVKNFDQVVKWGIEGDPKPNTGILTEDAKFYEDATYFNLDYNTKWSEKFQYGGFSADNLGGTIYLVKADGMIYEYTDSMGYDNHVQATFHHVIEDAEYIVSVPSGKWTLEHVQPNVIIVRNPFR